MRRILSLTPLLALLLFAACEVDERPATTTTDDTAMATTAMDEELRTDLRSRLNDIESSLQDLEQRVQDPSFTGDTEDYNNRIAELREEHQELEQRLAEVGMTGAGTTATTLDPATTTDPVTTTDPATASDPAVNPRPIEPTGTFEGLLSDVQGLELRTERMLIEASTSADEVRSTVQENLTSIDQLTNRFTQAEAGWRESYQERRQELEEQLTELETATADNFESARSDVESAYADLRDLVYSAERDHYSTAFASTDTGATTGTTTTY